MRDVDVVGLELNEIRLKEHLGFVTSDTSISQFSFFASPLKNRIGIGKEDYVLVDHPVLGEACPLLGIVKEIKNYEEVMGATLGDKSVKMVAVADVLGYLDLKDEIKPLREISVPPDPGSKVYLPYAEFMNDILLRDSDGLPYRCPLHMGKRESRATSRNGDERHLNFCFDIADFTEQHFLITGMSGAGKTHIASVIVEELANKSDLRVVILDPYGEYASIGIAREDLGNQVMENGVRLEDYNFGFNVSLYTSDPEGFTRSLEKLGIGGKDLARFKFTNVETARPEAATTKFVSSEVRQGEISLEKLTVLDYRGLANEERINLASSFVESLWMNRVHGLCEPFVLIVEEVSDIGAELLERIASQGRKFGVSLCLLSQHPTQIGGGVLSQMGTQIMGRTTDPDDLKYLSSMANEKSGGLPHLRRGECFINGMTLRQPTKVYVRDRYSLRH